VLKAFITRFRLLTDSRALDLEDVNAAIEGVELCLFVDRSELVESGCGEIERCVEEDHFDPRHVLAVTYHGEGKGKLKN